MIAILGFFTSGWWRWVALAGAILAAIVWHQHAAQQVIDRAVVAAIAENNGKWRAQIKASDDEAQAKLKAQQDAADAAAKQHADDTAALERRLAELEQANASLPPSAPADTSAVEPPIPAPRPSRPLERPGGIGRDRVRLLNGLLTEH